MSVVYNPLSGNFETKEPGPQGPAGTVSAAGDGSQGTPSISFASESNTGLYKYADESIAISTGGTGKLFIDSNGRVGIGEANPSHKLDIVGNSNQIVTSRVSNPDVGVRLSAYTNQHAEIRVETNHPLVFKTNGNNERLRIENSGAASFKGGTVLVEATSNTANAQLSLGRPNSTSAGYIRYINNENAMAFRTNGSGEDMRLDSSGRLGLGTTLPSTALHVNSTNNFTIAGTIQTNAGNSYVSFVDNGTTAGHVRCGSQGNDFVVNAGGDRRMQITSAGNVGIGVTNPQARLEIGGTETAGVPAIDVSTYAADVTDTSDIVLSPNGVIRAQDSINNVVNSGGFYTWNIGGTDDKAGKAGSSESMRLDASGNLKLGGSTISTSPNINLKADGQGEFAAGNVVLKSGSGYSSVEVKNTAQRYSLGTDGATNNLRVYNGTTSTTFSSWRTNGDFYHGGGTANGTDISSPNIRLNANGSAEFKARVTSNRATDGYAFEVNYNSVLRGGIYASSTGASLVLRIPAVLLMFPLMGLTVLPRSWVVLV